MKKLFLFLLLSSLFAQLSIAQSETENEANKQFSEDSIKIYGLEQEYVFKDCGVQPKVLTSAVVRYEYGAEAYIELDKPIEDNSILKLNGEINREVQITINDNKITVTKIPLDLALTLTIDDICGNSLMLTTIETGVNDQNYINVSSRKLFDLVNLWANEENKSRQSLPEYVLGLEGISRYEKLSFIQDYFFNDSSFPENIEDAKIIQSIVENSRKGGGDCNCKVLQLKTDGNMNPGFSNHSTGGPTATQGGLINMEVKNNKRSRWGYNSVYKGPSKGVSALYVQACTSACGGKREKVIRTQDGANGAGTPLLAEILYSLICVGAQQDPGMCDCKKRVDVAYRYDTKINTETNKYLYALIKPNSASVEVEDWAAVIVEDENGRRVEAVEGVRATGECNMQVNKNFIISAIDMAAAIAATAATGGTLAPVLATEIKKVINQDVFTANSCSSETQTKTLVDKTSTLFLAPGKVASAKIYSFDYIKLAGENGFFSAARINSDFLLATSIPGGTGGKLASCCMAPKADWLSASINGPLTEPELVGRINLFTTKNGMNATTNVGTVIGSHVENCGKIDGIQIVK